MGERFWMAKGRKIAAAARPLLDFALPPRCPACGVIVADDHRFCLDCWSGIRFLGDPCCARCGVPFAFDPGTGAECAACLSDPPPYDRARAAIAYGDIARQVALKLKYGRRVGLARLIAAHLARHIPEDGRDDMLLIPVPLHRWRIWARGFNQSALIANALSRLTGLPVEAELLLRIRATPALKSKSPAARRRTVRGAFALAPRAADVLAGRTVVLVDDVHTSGATAEACSLLLRRGGAAAVHLVCWSRVLPDDD